MSYNKIILLISSLAILNGCASTSENEPYKKELNNFQVSFSVSKAFKKEEFSKQQLETLESELNKALWRQSQNSPHITKLYSDGKKIIDKAFENHTIPKSRIAESVYSKATLQTWFENSLITFFQTQAPLINSDISLIGYDGLKVAEQEAVEIREDKSKKSYVAVLYDVAYVQKGLEHRGEKYYSAGAGVLYINIDTQETDEKVTFTLNNFKFLQQNPVFLGVSAIADIELDINKLKELQTDFHFNTSERFENPFQDDLYSLRKEVNKSIFELRKTKYNIYRTKVLNKQKTFLANIAPGSVTNCGLVISVKPSILEIQNDSGKTKWYQKTDIFPNTFSCETPIKPLH